MTSWTRAELGWMAVTIAALAFRGVVAFSTELYFDEAYYWLWSQHLDLGYFDHGPLIAWGIAVFGVRPFALLCGVGTVVAVYFLARRFHGADDRVAALRASAIWATVPVGALAGIFATPDAPLLLFWTLALGALTSERWFLLGLAGGLALLSKYTAGLLGVAHLVHGALRRRIVLQSAIAAGIAVLCFLPPILWNARHDWAGFRFQLGHGLGGGGNPRALAEYALGQLLLGGPVLAPLAVLWAFGGPRGERLWRLSTSVPLVFFALASLRARGEANWAAMAYPAAAIALGVQRRAAIAAVAGGALVLAVGGAQLLRPFLDGPAMTPVARVHGWKALARLRAEGFTAVLAPSYQLASEVAYSARLPVGVVGATRPSQFDFWPAPPLPSEGILAFVNEGGPPPEALRLRYRVDGPEVWPAEHRGRTVHTFYVYRVTPFPAAASK